MSCCYYDYFCCFCCGWWCILFLTIYLYVIYSPYLLSTCSMPRTEQITGNMGIQDSFQSLQGSWSSRELGVMETVWVEGNPGYPRNHTGNKEEIGSDFRDGIHNWVRKNKRESLSVERKKGSPPLPSWTSPTPLVYTILLEWQHPWVTKQTRLLVFAACLLCAQCWGSVHRELTIWLRCQDLSKANHEKTRAPRMRTGIVCKVQFVIVNDPW